MPVEVEGCAASASSSRKRIAQTGGAAGAAASVAFIAPFDSLLWDTALLASLFDFDFVWKGFFKAEKRRSGYDALPILFGDRLVGRIEPRSTGRRAAWKCSGSGREEGLRAAPSRRVRRGDAGRTQRLIALSPMPTASRGRRDLAAERRFSRHELAEGEVEAFRRLHAERLLRDAEPVGRRHRRRAGADRVPGAGDDERRARLVARPSRQRRAPRRGARASSSGRGRRGCPGECGLRARFRARTARRRGEREARHRDRHRRAVDRGFDRRSRRAALPLRPRRRARSGGAAGDRRERHGGPPHRPLRGVRRRPARISRRRSAGCRLTRRPERTASTRRVSGRRSRCRPSSTPSRPSP